VTVNTTDGLTRPVQLRPGPPRASAGTDRTIACTVAMPTSLRPVALKLATDRVEVSPGRPLELKV